MAKKKWPRLPSYLIPLFNTATVYLCRTKQEFTDAMACIKCSADGIEHNNGICRQFVNGSTGEIIYVIGVFNGSISTLVHECAHATFFVCGDVGVTTNPDEANETYCYLLDRMFSHFLPHIQKQTEANNDNAQP